MARDKIIKDIDKLKDIGDLPYDLMAKVLKHIQRADQLNELEQRCPQLRGKTDDIWKRLIQRDAGHHADILDGPGRVTIKSYYKTYKKLVERKTKADDAARAVLAKRVAAINKTKRENTTILDSDGTLIPEAMAPSAPNATHRLLAQHYGKVGSKPEPVPAKRVAPKPSTVQRLVTGVIRDHKAKGLNMNKRKREPDVSPERAEIAKKVFPPLVKRKRM